MSVDRAAYQQALRADGEAIAVAGRRDLGTQVPSCPGWTMHKLLAHVGRVYRSVGRHVAERATQMIPADQIPRPPEGNAIVEWFEDGHRFVQEALDGADPDDAVWTWAGPNNMAFYFRRMAHETAVHRWDAEAALGEPTPLDPDLSADGVSELYELVLPFTVANWDVALPATSLHLHRTDGDGEWLLVNDSGRIRMSHQHAKGDAAVRAGGAELLLLAWERIGLETPGVEVFGDAGTARAWFALSR
ncbi:maleylpyruvate isomerase family mycothiol-dependent enzyme [Candidatus Poriferisocius sp.]|uniref:maleylpyruvate isomerase family mycothiol-dependent enzyme n=1 Tax=Candidatus Poriferisocius sp. TaxID=3101276 RepID=UPI003B02C2DF